jgi:DNA-binding transcriptional MocR family regulator
MTESTSTDEVAAALRTTAAGMRPGERLASTREISARHRVSPVTVSRALAALRVEGVLVTRPGSGTYVADRPSGGASATQDGLDTSWQTVALGDRTVDAASVAFLLAPHQAGAISLAGGYPHPSLLPTRALAAAIGRAARRPDASERPPLQGISGLRQWFAASVDRELSGEDVLITTGAQSALSAAFRAIAPAGAPVLVESPTYIGALAAARAARFSPVPVPGDRDGVRPDLLADAFAATGSRVFYCQPTYQNPTGSVLAPERRREVLAVARDAGAFVIEDDYARHLNHERPAPPPLISADEDGRVVHIASLTKATSPNLRIGALIARGPVAERLRSLRIVDDFFVPRPLQEAALELVGAPSWRRHLSALSRALTDRRGVLLAALAEHLPGARPARVPAGGLNVWIALPEPTDDVALAGACRDAGVLISPGRPYHAAEPPRPYARLSFAAAPSAAALEEGVRRLARAVATGRS